MMLLWLIALAHAEKLLFGDQEKERELQEFTTLMDAIAQNMTGDERTEFEAYAKILEDEMRLVENITEDNHGPGHVHVKYLPDAIIEILKLFHPDPFDSAFKHHLLDHYSHRDAVKMYNAFHNRSEAISGDVGPNLTLIRDNTEWHKALHSNEEQQGYLRRFHAIPHTQLVVTDTVSHLIQNSKTCWILMTIDSVIADADDIKWGKRVANAFFERCAVGYVDVSYPSNYDLFKNFTIDGRAGWLIGRYPGAHMIDTNYRSVPWKFELVNIEYWGKSIPAKLFAQFPNHVIRALDHEFYETMMDDSAKIEAIYAYDDRQKDAMKERIIHYNTVKYRYIMGKTGHDIKLGKYEYGGEDYIRHFIEYENEFKATKSMREFLKTKLDYPKEIYGRQVMRLNPKPVHYEL